ncbi:MAG: glycoside hydrolase domain-containing protein [Allomuricauda sp.]
MSLKHIYIVALLMVLGCQKQKSSVQFEFVDPLEKVLPQRTFFTPAEAHADVARGEHASFQFVVRSNADISKLRVQVTAPSNSGKSLSDIKKGFVGFVKVGRTNPDPSNDIIKSNSGYFPDPIIYTENKDVPFGTTQPIWVSVKVPEDALQGTYNGEITVHGEIDGESFTKTKAISLKVFKPVISKTSLWVTNWFFLDRLDYLNNNQPVEQYSDTYWELARIMARMLSEYRQNMAMISPLDHTEFTYENGIWSFDFSNFNKLVNLFIDEGVIGRLEGGHFGNRIDGSWEGDFGLKVPTIEKDTTYLETKSLVDTETRTFYNQFLPALFQNIQNKGWENTYVQHIADEPIDANFASYIEISDYIKSIVPQIKIIEACHTAKLEGKIDIWVPQMNFLDEDLDFYKKQQSKGDEAWYYTCLAPKGEYANRFIELPLIKTRLLHWVNHKYEIPGYLHWGFNYWGSKGGITTSDNPYEDASGLIGSSGNVLPGGDCWISYPAFKEIYPSIRLEAMRDGIVDYELLKMYSEKYPEEAKDMVNTTVYNFEHYDTNIGDFRKKRKKILEALSVD